MMANRNEQERVLDTTRDLMLATCHFARTGNPPRQFYVDEMLSRDINKAIDVWSQIPLGVQKYAIFFWAFTFAKSLESQGKVIAERAK